jgi:uncharacterized membrane-anchored protein
MENKNQYLRLIIALIVLFAIVISFVIYLSWPMLTGKIIVLRTAPVDPYDLVRGQYISIRYEISTIPLIDEAKVGDEVYVKLVQNEEDIWNYSSASLGKPNSGTFIKGEITNIYGNKMNVKYGIEQFFFERNAEFSVRNMTVEAKVSSSGQARIVSLLQNNEPLQMEFN